MIYQRYLALLCTFSFLLPIPFSYAEITESLAALQAINAARDLEITALEEKKNATPEGEEKERLEQELAMKKLDRSKANQSTSDVAKRVEKAGTSSSAEAHKSGPKGLSREEASQYRKAYEGTRSTDGKNPLTGEKIEDSIAGENAKVREMFDHMENTWKNAPNSDPRKAAALESIQNARQQQTYSEPFAKAMDRYVANNGGDITALEKTAFDSNIAKINPQAAEFTQAARILFGGSEGAMPSVPTTPSKASTVTTPQTPKLNVANLEAYRNSYSSNPGFVTADAMSGSTLNVGNGQNLTYTGTITIPGQGLVHTWGGQSGQYAYLASGEYIQLPQLATPRR